MDLLYIAAMSNLSSLLFSLLPLPPDGPQTNIYAEIAGDAFGSMIGVGSGFEEFRDVINDMLFVMGLNAPSIANTLKATKRDRHAVRYLQVIRGMFAIPFVAVVAILEEMHR